MKKGFSLTVVAIALLLTSFKISNSIIKPKYQSTSLVKINLQATPFNTHTEYTLEGLPFTSCSGEVIVINATVKEFLNGVYNTKTNTLQITSHYDFKADAVGETSGIKYALHDIGNGILTYEFSGNTLAIQGTESFRFNAQGAAEDIVVKQNYSYTIDLITGETTFSRNFQRFECQ